MQNMHYKPRIIQYKINVYLVVSYLFNFPVLLKVSIDI